MSVYGSGRVEEHCEVTPPSALESPWAIPRCIGRTGPVSDVPCSLALRLGVAVRFVSLLVLPLTATLVAVMGWQHFRYLDWRRTAAQDHQPLLHSSSAFRVISYLRLVPGSDLVESLAKARETLEGAGGNQWVYAGKVVLMGLQSKGDVDCRARDAGMA